MSEAETVVDETTTDDGSTEADQTDVSTRLRELGVSVLFGLVALGGWLYSTSKRGAEQTHTKTAAGVSALGGALVAYAAPVAAVALAGVSVAAVSAALFALYRR